MERYYQPEIECASREQILAWQNERLVKQVRHVWDNVPYYRKKMEEKGVTPDDIQSVADLHKLPFLSKDGWVVTSSEPLVNIPNYPETDKIIADIKALPHHRLLPIGQLAREAKAPKSANMLLLGMVADLIELVSPDNLLSAISAVFDRKGEAVVEANRQAFLLGQKGIER